MRSPLLGATREVTLNEGTIRFHVRGTGPVLVFVHGVLANANLWRNVVDRLAPRFTCITPDWPLGAHEIPMAPSAALSPPALTRLIAEFLVCCGLDDVTLVGNDSGGALCQMLVTTRPERVARLVLTSCDAFEIWLPRMFRYLELSAHAVPLFWLLIQTLRLRVLRRLPFAFGWLTKRPIPAVWSDSYVRPSIESKAIRHDAAKVLRGISPAYTLEAAKHFHTFTKPTLIAWAREDRFFPVRHAEALAARFPNARLSLIDDALTFLSEDRPDAVAQCIESFLSATSGLTVTNEFDGHLEHSARRDTDEVVERS